MVLSCNSKHLGGRGRSSGAAVVTKHVQSQLELHKMLSNKSKGFGEEDLREGKPRSEYRV